MLSFNYLLVFGMLFLFLTVLHVAYSHLVKPSTAAGCPLEHYHGVREVNPKPHYPIGEEIVFECEASSTEDPEHFYYENFKEEFIVLPSPKRKCQTNYTWSGVPPICVRKNILKLKAPDQLGIRASNSIHCADNAICMEALEKWPAVVHTSRADSEKNPDDIKTEYQEVLFNFSRHFHFGYMAFVQPSNGEFTAVVRGRNSDKITEFSEDASEFNTIYYKVLKDLYNEKDKEKHVIIPLNCYSNQMTVTFSTGKTTVTQSKPEQFVYDWKPKPIFYPIPEPDIKRMKFLSNRGCPERPEIANAEAYLMSHSKIRYVCNPGFEMVNPITMELSNGIIECSNRFEWTPYPFPICLAVVLSWTPDNIGSEHVQHQTDPSPRDTDAQDDRDSDASTAASAEGFLNVYAAIILLVFNVTY